MKQEAGSPWHKPSMLDGPFAFSQEGEMIPSYYDRLQIQHFKEKGYIRFSNTSYIQRYLALLQDNTVCVITGLGMFSLEQAICKPEKLPRFIAELNDRIADLQRQLRRSQAGLLAAIAAAEPALPVPNDAEGSEVEGPAGAEGELDGQGNS